MDSRPSQLGPGDAVDVRAAGRWRWTRADTSMLGRLVGGDHQRGRRGWSSVGDVEESRPTASVFSTRALGWAGDVTKGASSGEVAPAGDMGASGSGRVRVRACALQI
jgi:hypothetical protein